MAVAPDDWRLIASGDSTAVPSVELPGGQDYLIVIDLPVAVPAWLADALASGLWTAVATFATVRGVSVVGATVTIEMAG